MYDGFMFSVRCHHGAEESPRGGAAARAPGLDTAALAAAGSSDGSAVIVVLAVVTAIMFSVFIAIFGAKFRRAWSQGAQGGQLIRESFRIN